MSKKENTPMERGVLDHNSAQVSATKEIVDNHDSHAVHLLRKEQARVSQKLKQQRQQGHHEYEVIEAEAHAILQQAHQEGEIHIRSRHTSTPMFFYVVDTNVLMVWCDGKSEKIGSIPNFGSNSLFRVSGYKIDINNKAVVGGIASLLYTDQSDKKQLCLSLICKDANGKYKIEHAAYQTTNDSGKNVDDLIFSENGVFGASWKTGDIVTWILSSPESHERVLANSSIQAPFRSVVFHDHRTDRILTINKSLILSYSRIPDDNKTTTDILQPGIAKIPIDLAIHSNNNALLIQDAGKNEIGLFLLGSKQERVWRSFASDSQITLNQGVFQSDRTFTISCLLKINCKQNYIVEPIYADPFKIWVDRKSGLLNLQYKVGTQTYHFTSPEGKKLTEYQYSDWFLFSMQKEGDEVRFYIDGVLFCSFQTEHFPSLRSSKVLFSMPGFFICELRIWRTIRTPEQLMRFKRSWIPPSEFDGLMGYWHLFVNGNAADPTGLIWNKHDASGKVIEVQQEPDLTGNGNHLITNSNPLKTGDLNRETEFKYTAKSPFPEVIPIYELGVIQQGLRIDDNTGLIYWIDEIGDTCNRRFAMMVGSALGHLAPRIVFEANVKRGFSVLSQFNSAYERLMIAHANRRDAMEKQIIGIGDQHRESHVLVQSAHDDLAKELSKSEMELFDNMPEYTKVHDEWLRELNRIADEEETAMRLASERRNRAIDTAKQMTDAAQLRVIAHRRMRD